MNAADVRAYSRALERRERIRRAQARARRAYWLERARAAEGAGRVEPPALVRAVLESEAGRRD